MQEDLGSLPGSASPALASDPQGWPQALGGRVVSGLCVSIEFGEQTLQRWWDAYCFPPVALPTLYTHVSVGAQQTWQAQLG